MASEIQISDPEKVEIFSKFLLHAPPGEINEVFNDIRSIVDDDELLKENAPEVLARYNKDQFTQCRLGDGANVDSTLITEYGDLQNGRFFDPITNQTFRYDHMRREASDIQKNKLATTISVEDDSWRTSLQTSLNSYVENNFKNGVGVVYCKKDADSNTVLIICLESHLFNAKNFWNGRWRSQWTVTFVGSSVELVADIKVRVHYYEDGNIQLVSSKDIHSNVEIGGKSATCDKIIKLISATETDYQTAITENYQTMSDTTFKALRRQLPVTRQKIDWNNILSYKVASELKQTSN